MDPLVQFEIPVSGLKDGLHPFDFQLNNEFFECFEASPLKEGNVNVKVYFDKRPDMYVITFDIKGAVKTTCDRCLDEFILPIQSSESLMFKFAAEEREEADIVYILKGATSLNIANYIYDYVNLALPMMKTHDDAEEECNSEITDYLNNQNQEEETKPQSDKNPIWDALKNFKKTD